MGTPSKEYFLEAVKLNRMKIPRTHNLVELVSLCLEIDGTFLILEPELRGLDGYAVRTRYPGQNANKEEAIKALNISKGIRSFYSKENFG